MNIKKNIGNGKPRQVHVPYSLRTLSITCSTRSHNSPCLLTSSSTPQRSLVWSTKKGPIPKGKTYHLLWLRHMNGNEDFPLQCSLVKKRLNKTLLQPSTTSGRCPLLSKGHTRPFFNFQTMTSALSTSFLSMASCIGKETLPFYVHGHNLASMSVWKGVSANTYQG